MPVFTKDARSVLFVHIPKAAGSTLERMFVRTGWEMSLRETRKTHPQLMPLRRCSPQHYHAALLQQLLVVERFDAVFTVTRDPVRRFCSEYLMRNTADPRTDAASIDAWSGKAFERRARDPYWLDNHLRPQHEFLLPGAQVYRLEDGLESTVTDLNARFELGLPSQIPQALNSVRRTGIRSDELDLSDGLLATLRTVYAEDFSTFGY